MTCALQAIDNSHTAELLHQCYIHLSGRNANPDDLKVSLEDIQLGLKQTALAQARALVNSAGIPVRSAHGLAAASADAGGNPANNLTPGMSTLGEVVGGNVHGGPLNASEGSVPPLRAVSAAGLPTPTYGQGPITARTFHVSLIQVATFLRQAGLVPRLLSKYISQLQQEAEDADHVLHRGVPLMPSLRARVRPSEGLRMPMLVAKRRM